MAVIVCLSLSVCILIRVWKNNLTVLAENTSLFFFSEQAAWDWSGRSDETAGHRGQLHPCAQETAG